MGCPCSKCREGDNEAARNTAIELTGNIRKLIRPCAKFKAMAEYTARNASEISFSKGDFLEIYATAGGKLTPWVFAALIKETSIDVGYAHMKMLAEIDSPEAEEFHFGAISQEETEALLKNSPKGSFIIRLNSEGLSEVCVSFGSRVKSFEILVEAERVQSGNGVITEHRFFINKGRKNRFASVVDLVMFLKLNDVIGCNLTNSPPKPLPIFDPVPANYQKDFVKIPWSKIKVLGDLGKGENAKVEKGDWEKAPGVKVPVAIKQASASTLKQLKAFITEAAVMIGLDHPNLMKLHGVIVDTCPIRMVVEYVNGKTLADYLKDRKARKMFLREDQLVDNLKEVVKAMHYLQSKQLSHDDLTTLNVMIIPDKRDDMPVRVKLIDFGFAKAYKLGNAINTEEREALKKVGPHAARLIYKK